MHGLRYAGGSANSVTTVLVQFSNEPPFPGAVTTRGGVPGLLRLPERIASPGASSKRRLRDPATFGDGNAVPAAVY